MIYHIAGIVIELQGVLQPTTSAASDPRGAQVAGAASEAVGEHEARSDGRRALRAESVQPAAAEREAEAELEHHQRQQEEAGTVAVEDEVGHKCQVGFKKTRTRMIF